MDLISKIQKFHYSKLHFSALTVLFAPISFLYFIFISTKNFLYKINLLKSKKVDINDPELHNNEERKELRKKEGYEIISKSGNYDELKEG